MNKTHDVDGCHSPTAKRLFEIAWMSILRPTGSSSVQRPCTPMPLLLSAQGHQVPWVLRGEVHT